MIKKFIKEEKAVATIVEATVVFPIMFLVIIFMLFMGNAYYQMSRIDAIVAECAMEGAAACTDPFYYRVRDKVIYSRIVMLSELTATRAISKRYE